MDNRNKRIIREIKELEESRENLESNGIYYYYDDNDINNIYAMIIGQEGTPYEKGFYFFKFTFSKNYPFQEPLAKYYTQGYLNYSGQKTHFLIRFNPNLYTCGKVCLSMLNTWKGDGWTPALSIIKVMLAIQTLVLIDYPFRNEPSFENSHVTILKKYNDIIEYSNIKIAVIKMILDTPNQFIYFKEIMEKFFLKNIEFYRKLVLDKNDYYNSKESKLLETPIWGQNTDADYGTVLSELLNLEDFLISKYQSEEVKLCKSIETTIIV